MENYKLLKETNQGKLTSFIMMFFHRIHYYPIVQAVISVCGTLISFITAYARGDVSIYLPFISETGAFSPEMCIFSMTLILSSFLGVLNVFSFYTISRQNALSGTQSVSLLNNISLIVGVISMFGLAGVAAFPMTTVFWAHLLCATMYFLGSGIYFIFITIMTYKTEGASRKFKWRLGLTIAIMIFLSLLTLLFPMALKKWRKYNDGIPALKTPDKQGFTLLLLSAIMEWSIVIIILIFMLTLIIEMKNYLFELTVTESPKRSTVVVGPISPDPLN